MSKHPEIRLRYFAARARAQFLRGYFAAREIDYQDDRVAIDEGFAAWIEMRDDRSLTGPLKRLPVLHYGDQLIPETTVIAGFVHRTFGDQALLSDQANLRHEVLVSTANIDLLMPIAMLIWADLMFEGIDLPVYAKRTLERLNKNFDVIDQAIGDWNWVEDMNKRPVTVADCMLWEEIDQAITVFGPHFTLEGFPRLGRLYAEHPARRKFEQLLTESPCQISGRPGELTAIEQIQSVLSEAEAGTDT